MKAIIVRMPDELLEALNDEAKRLGIARNALILQALWNMIQKKVI